MTTNTTTNISPINGTILDPLTLVISHVSVSAIKALHSRNHAKYEVLVDIGYKLSLMQH